VSEDIEADAHVGDGGGSEGGDLVRHKDSAALQMGAEIGRQAQ
jgi:hypothetical protein